jgi:hypothetical protein
VRPKDLKQWVCWRTEERSGKSTKVPYSPATGARARSDDRATWDTFAEAREAAEKPGYDGIGFVFTAGDPFCGVDLDECVDPETGEVEPWALDLIKELDSYSELSPSGRGLHVLVRAKLPEGGNRKGRIEMYDRGRFFTVTGNRLPGAPNRIEDRQERVEALHARLFPCFQREQIPPATSGAAANGLADEEVVRRAMSAANGEKFARLWMGDRSGYASDSEADLALCSMLAFWTGSDEERIASLFARSGLAREKWSREDYRRRTVRKALAGAGEFYALAARTPDTGHDEAPVKDVVPDTKGTLPEAVEFPVEAMPGACRRLVGEATASLGCAPELVALPMLATLSSAIGASRVVEVKGGWREGATLFLAVVASPGAMKTPAAKVAKKPAFERQRGLGKAYTEKKEDYRRDLLRWEAEKKEAGKRGEVLEEAPPSPPSMGRCLAGDTTIEALVSVLGDNPRGLLVYRDELAGWVRSMDQYKGGRGSDRQNWLNLWTADEVIVDRKSRMGEPIILAKPFVSLFGGIQPAMLGELGGTMEDGMMDRFLFGYPAARHIRFSEKEIGPEAEAEYADLYHRLSELPLITDEHGDPNPKPLKLSFEARRLFAECVNSLGAEIVEPGFPARLEGVWSKLRGYLARLSLVLAVCRCATNDVREERVEREDVEAASKLIGYFKTHARRVYAELKAPDPSEVLAADPKGLLETAPDGRLEATATELFEELQEAGCDALPARPKELSQMVKVFADRSSTLRASFGWRGKDKVIRLELTRPESEISVGRVGSVGESPVLAASTNATNATYARFEDQTGASTDATNATYAKPGDQGQGGSHVRERNEWETPTEEERILEVLRDPPGWMRDTYLRGYREGRWNTRLVSAGVATALGMSPHEDGPRIRQPVEQALEKLGIEQG